MAPAPSPSGGPTDIPVEWNFPSALGLNAYPPMMAKVGDTATFTWQGTHGVWRTPDAACPAEFVSSPPNSQEIAPVAGGGTVTVTFDEPGTYTYVCQVRARPLPARPPYATLAVSAEHAPPWAKHLTRPVRSLLPRRWAVTAAAACSSLSPWRPETCLAGAQPAAAAAHRAPAASIDLP